MKERKRAVSEEQKYARRDHILSTALRLLEKSRFQDISIAEIADQSGLAKGTIFLYFKTKEELFLALTDRGFQGWFDEIDRDLEARERVTEEELVDIILKTIKNRKALVKLISILHVILEHNIDMDSARNFKHDLHKRLINTSEKLDRIYPPARNGNGMRILFWVYTLVIGVEHLAEPADVVKQINREPGMELHNIDFDNFFADMIGTLLKGLKMEQES